MSQPPISSPFTYSCGYVGQLLYVFSPCLTSSSWRISNVSYGTPVAVSASLTRRLKPQRGSCGLPFMKRSTSAECRSFFRRVSRGSSSSFPPMSSVFSSPDSAISITMSQPPISSPFTYSCGYVGQLLYVFSPCLTSSSWRISNVSYGTPVAVSASLTRRLKPQRGSCGLPFMKRSTSAECRSFFRRFSRGSFAAGSAFAPAPDPAPRCCSTFALRAGAFAPSRVSTTCLPLRKAK